MIWCLFEQSGTFKNCAKKLGINAVDVDILNNFGETDVQTDLFDQIEKAYKDENSIFDDIKREDVILAFFPCQKFTEKIFVNAKANTKWGNKWSDEKKIEYSMSFMKDVNRYFSLFCKLNIVARRRGLRLICENPHPNMHYLNLFYPFNPSVIDNNRADHGDYYRKPTQYWFTNLEVKPTLVLSPFSGNPQSTVKDARINKGKTTKERRSMLSEDYAKWFLQTYITDNLEANNEQRS